MTKTRVAVFASGTGSNFQAMLEQHENLGCEIVLLVCDKPEATVLEKAHTYGIPTFVFNPREYVSKVAYEQALVHKLHETNIQWIFLAGYMRIVGETLLHAYDGKIINIHPSFLPAFPGLDAIGQAFEARVEKTGVTIHYVDEGIDTGPIIAQEEVKVFPNDTRDTLQERIQEVEHRLFPKVIRKLMKAID